MNFDLSENHKLLANTVKRYLADNHSIEERSKTAFEKPFHAAEIWAGLCELGIIGAFVSEEQGGFGGSAQDVAVVFEEVGRGLCAEPLLGTLLGLRVLVACGRLDLAEILISGEARCALAVFEPNVTCDLSSLEATARRHGDRWLLNGRKSAIYGAPAAEHVLITADTGAGIGVFLAHSPELIGAAMYDGGGTADLVMEDLPAECLAEESRETIEDALDLGRIALCAEAVGIMAHLTDLTIDYLKQRRQFGRPIATFQALQHRLVDMLVEVEQCRSITIGAIAAYGSPLQKRAVSMAKNLVGRMGSRIAEEAIQMHGGIGMTWEYSASHYAKRLIMLDHQLGDRYDHVQRLVSLRTGA